MSVAKAKLDIELNDLLVERNRLIGRLKQEPDKDYLFIIACSAMTAWWIIIGICVVVWLQSVGGIWMILLTVPAMIIFAIFWKDSPLDSRSPGLQAARAALHPGYGRITSASA